MPLYDIPGRDTPVRITLSRDGVEHIFQLPYDTDDPVKIALISKHPGVQEVPAPGPPPVSDSTQEWVFDPLPEITEETVTGFRTRSTPRKTSRKEVQ